MNHKITEAEILEMAERNENFDGKFADMNKAASYHAILRSLLKAAEDNPYIIDISTSPASVNKRWGMIYIDLSGVSLFSGVALAAIQNCIASADTVAFASSPNPNSKPTGVRLTVGFDIWK